MPIAGVRFPMWKWHPCHGPFGHRRRVHSCHLMDVLENKEEFLNRKRGL